MKPISDFFPWVLPHLPGCPEPLAIQALRDAAIAFCEDSSAVRVTLDPVAVQQGVARYDLDAPAQQVVARVISASFNGVPLSPVSSGDVAHLPDAAGDPTTFYTRQGDSGLEITLYPTPAAVGVLTPTVATLPARGATQLADELYTYWNEAVTAGAVSRVKSIPAQPFSDPAGAVGYAAAALAGSRKARIEGQFGRSQSRVRVRPHPFA